MPFPRESASSKILVQRLIPLLLGLAAIGMIATSCHDGLLAPKSSVGDGSSGRASPPAAIPVRPYPVLTRVPRLVVRAEAVRGALVVHGELLGRESGVRPFYDGMHEGGWMLQLFVNTDEADTGYWLGYDYIVRGGEWSPTQGTMVTRKITLEGQYPGGWGPESGLATFKLDGHAFDLVVPLASLGGDDGNVDFALETYATVSCPECVGGISQVFAADYFGSSSGSREPVAFAPGYSSNALLGVRWTPRPNHSANADPAGGLVLRSTPPRLPAP